MRIIKTIIHGLMVVGLLIAALIMATVSLINNVIYLTTGIIRYWMYRLVTWFCKTTQVDECDKQRVNHHINGVSKWDYIWAERLSKVRVE